MTTSTAELPAVSRHSTSEETLWDAQGRQWVFVLALHSWMQDSGDQIMLRDRARLDAQFGPLTGTPAGPAGETADELPGCLAAPPAVHGTDATQVLPAVSDGAAER